MFRCFHILLSCFWRGFTLSFFGGGLYSQSPPKVVDVFAGYQFQSSWSAGGYGFGAGLRYGHHEFSGAFYPNINQRTGIGSYRFYFPIKQNRCMPYLSLNGGLGRKDRFFAQYGLGANTKSLGLGVGVMYRVWRGTHVFFQIGSAWDGIHVPEIEYHLTFLGHHALAGLRYEIRLRGPRFEKNEVFDSGETNSKIHVRVSAGYVPSILPFLGSSVELYLPPVTGTIEYNIKPWFRVYAGAEFAPLEDDFARPPRYKRMGFSGITAGARLFPIQRKTWAFFSEAGLVFHTRKNWNLWGVRPKIGHGFSVKVVRGLDLEAFATYELFDYLQYVRFSAGLSIGTEIFLRNREPEQLPQN